MGSAELRASTCAGSAYAGADSDRGPIYLLRGVNDEAGRWAGVHSLPRTLRLDGDRVVADSGGIPTVARDGRADVASLGDVVLHPRRPRLMLTLDGDALHALVAPRKVTARTAGWT